MQQVKCTKTENDGVAVPSGPFQLRGNFVTAMVLRLIEPDHPDFFALLNERIGQAPNFYRRAPVVMDLKDMATANRAVDFQTLAAQIRGVGMIPVGVLNASPAQQEAAFGAGLAVVPQGRSNAAEDHPRAQATVQAPAPAPLAPALASVPVSPPAVPAPRRPSKLIVEPVRSGQVIYAHDTDLIVMAGVSSGAELLADGHIHVYGPLRGRALAGVSGDEGARIFCRSLEAELVSIAGLYKLSDNFDPALWRQPTHISLSGNTLTMVPLA
ncbi:MAG: septum site-determining protein MinC [Alphaproteobacteria bacterium]|nr:septum site-determining protein MinC [Alphaproteobacteria bacterium]